MNIFEKLITGIGATLYLIVMMTITAVLYSLLVRFAWNASIPYIFHLPTISWFQAWCLTFLASVLVKQYK